MIDPLKHQRLVRSVANRFRKFGVPFEDLVGYGQIGLLIACRKFDPSLGNEFSTYAVPWISHAMTLGTDFKRLISVPQNVQERLRYKHSKACASAQALRDGKRAMRWHMNEGSLESSSLKGLAEEILDHRDSDFGRCDAAHDVALLMRGLTDREARTVRLRYGLDGRGERSFREIAEEAGGISWQSAQQAYSRAMDKLRWAARVPEPRRASA